MSASRYVPVKKGFNALAEQVEYINRHAPVGRQREADRCLSVERIRVILGDLEIFRRSRRIIGAGRSRHFDGACHEWMWRAVVRVGASLKKGESECLVLRQHA